MEKLRPAFGISILSVFITWVTFGQSDPMHVERIRIVPDNLPILNIHIDEHNVKWVANSSELYRMEAKDSAIRMLFGPSEVSLLQFPGGNADIRWSKEKLAQILGIAEVTTASYDHRQKILWIGTNGYGVFKLQVNGDLRLIEQLHIDNSRLRSDFINSIYIDRNGIVWIATEDGAVSIDNNRWTHHQRYFNILRIHGQRHELWAIGDDLIWLIDRRGNWTPIDINRRQIEGEIHDIAVDAEGRIWIASNIMTAYRHATDRYQRFGPGQYFTSQFVNYVTVDTDGTIWVGTNDKGLYIIEKESTITVTTEIEKYLDCHAASSNAIVSIRTIGGTPPYRVHWPDHTTGDRHSGLSAGVYNITVTDVKGSSKTAVVEIADPFLDIEVMMERPESDENAYDGAARAEVKGGVAEYQLQWSNGSTGVLTTTLSAGIHHVTVTDAAGCTARGSIEIIRTIRPLALKVEQTEQIQCGGRETATLSIRATGGEPPFAYAWSREGMVQDQVIPAGFDPTVMLKSIGAGTYTLSVTDSQGNKATTSATILEPAPLAPVVRIDKIAGPNSSDGIASVQCTGGSGNYRYLWQNGVTTATAENLAAGTYNVTITDAAGCTATVEVVMHEEILPLTVAMRQTADIRCAGEDAGALSVDVSGGKGPYQYHWNQAGLQNHTVTGLKAGVYHLTVVDATGESRAAVAVISEPDALIATVRAIAPAHTNENNGRAVVQAGGGHGLYTYKWDNGETSLEAGALAAGIRTVTVTDENGCSAVGEVRITEEILPLTVALNIVSGVKCAGGLSGEIEAVIAGGKEPFQIIWTNGDQSTSLRSLSGGAYGVTVTDAVGNSAKQQIALHEPEALHANIEIQNMASVGVPDGKASVEIRGGTPPYDIRWSHGERSAATASLAPGPVSVTVTDQQGCVTTADAHIVEDILPMEVTARQTAEIQCAGNKSAAVSISVRGGKPPYRYTWDQQAGSGQATTGLTAGIYSVTVSDALGTSAVTTVEVDEPPALFADVRQLSAAGANIPDGRAVVEAHGGVGGYTYRWDNDETGNEAVRLGAGLRHVTVTDQAGCTVIATAQITEDISPLNVLIRLDSEISCAGASDGIMTALVSGGKAPFDLQWSDHSTGMSVRSTKAGQHSVTVTDAAGQSATAETLVREPQMLKVEIADIRSATHDRIADGRAAANISGGTPPYQYAWSNGETSMRAGQLSVGAHSVEITDAKGCRITASVAITERILPALTAENLARGEAIRMEKLQFAADSTVIDPESIPVLDELYAFLYDNPTIVVEIGGHTNGLPEHDYCDWLSTERAKSVADYIISKGIESRRVAYKGYGKRQPIATNMTPEGRRRNQRVEVRMVILSE